jgi:hypothetical protein
MSVKVNLETIKKIFDIIYKRANIISSILNIVFINII